MKNQYVQGELDTPLKESVNSLIMEIASDIASEKVSLNFGLDQYLHEKNGTTYTDEAQEVFNQYYDEEMDRLYSLVNEIKKLEEGTN
jgi:hypothetical protein